MFIKTPKGTLWGFSLNSLDQQLFENSRSFAINEHIGYCTSKTGHKNPYVPFLIFTLKKTGDFYRQFTGSDL
ncbi:MAG: hypothetical protein CVU46_17630 [Chloroflexi bacterium HGW-Chloroflexi-8]|jgi:hypothetical protein|nr:MAG: hypothetical protein CVU46_17630 [Chloroflexi bacterium HGW-Chloroflexi-8]